MQRSLLRSSYPLVPSSISKFKLRIFVFLVSGGSSPVLSFITFTIPHWKNLLYGSRAVPWAPRKHSILTLDSRP